MELKILKSISCVLRLKGLHLGTVLVSIIYSRMVGVNYQYADNFSVIIITDSTVIFTTFDDFQQMSGKSHSKYPQKISKLGRLSNSNY